MKSILVCALFLFSSMSNAHEHPWLDLIGKYITISVNGKPVPQEYSGTLGDIQLTTSPNYRDMDGNRITSLYFYLFNPYPLDRTSYTVFDALIMGDYSSVDDKRTYKFSGQLRKNYPGELATIDQKLTIRMLEPEIYEIHYQSSIEESDYAWKSNKTFIIKKIY